MCKVWVDIQVLKGQISAAGSAAQRDIFKIYATAHRLYMPRMLEARLMGMAA